MAGIPGDDDGVRDCPSGSGHNCVHGADPRPSSDGGAQLCRVASQRLVDVDQLTQANKPVDGMVATVVTRQALGEHDTRHERRPFSASMQLSQSRAVIGKRRDSTGVENEGQGRAF